MKVLYHREFIKNYKKRIDPNPKLVIKFKKQLDTFIKSPHDPSLKNHRLIGKMSKFYAFSVSGDIRVVYTIIEEDIWLYDIGSHNQVY